MATVDAMGLDMSELVFEDLQRIEIPVTIGKEKFILREADGDAACKYRNYVIKCTRMNAEGRPDRMEGLADAAPLLVSLCLFRRENNAPVPIAEVRKFKNSILNSLFEKAQQISELEDKDTEESLLKTIEKAQKRLEKLRENLPKKEPTDTKDGSS